MRHVGESKLEFDRETSTASKRNAGNSWIERLSDVMRHASDEVPSRLHTTLSCHVRGKRPILFLPPEMGTLQPQGLAYLRAFARRHSFGLVEDRRKIDLRPVTESRDRSPSKLAMGISLLLKQTGMPGGARTLSSPHRLNADSLHVDLAELVHMAALARRRSKRIVLLPNRMIVDMIGQDTHPIVGHACRLATTDSNTVLSQFESPSFRSIGYSTGRQYVMHVFLAGGSSDAPELWTRLQLFTHTDFRFRLFPGQRQGPDYGLFHATYFFEMSDGTKSPWWLKQEPDNPTLQ